MDRRCGKCYFFRKRADMMRAEDVAEAVLFAVTREVRVTVTEIRMAPTRR